MPCPYVSTKILASPTTCSQIPPNIVGDQHFVNTQLTLDSLDALKSFQESFWTYIAIMQLF